MCHPSSQGHRDTRWLEVEETNVTEAELGTLSFLRSRMEEMDVFCIGKRVTMLPTSYIYWRFVGFKSRPAIYSGLAGFRTGLTSKNLSR